jgi:hypothetical protein
MEEQSNSEKKPRNRSEYLMKYRQQNKDKINKNAREWAVNNAEYVKEYHCKYWIEKGDTIKEQRRTKIECPICNKFVSRQSMSTHRRSDLHLSKLKQNENNVE